MAPSFPMPLSVCRAGGPEGGGGGGGTHMAGGAPIWTAPEVIITKTSKYSANASETIDFTPLFMGTMFLEPIWLLWKKLIF